MRSPAPSGEVADYPSTPSSKKNRPFRWTTCAHLLLGRSLRSLPRKIWTKTPRNGYSNPSSKKNRPFRWTTSPSISMWESSLMSTSMSVWTELSFRSFPSGTHSS